MVYSGINGYLDDLPVEKTNEFVQGLKDYVTNNKPEFAEIIRSEKKLVEKAETLLKEAISEYKETFKASM
mgnify:FL=1